MRYGEKKLERRKSLVSRETRRDKEKMEVGVPYTATIITIICLLLHLPLWYCWIFCYGL